MDIRNGDTVMVIAGKEKGKRGRVDRILVAQSRVVVEGLNMVVRHVRPSATTRQAGRIQRESPLHVSNVILVCNKCSKPTRVTSNRIGDGRKVRECQRCKETID
jgi:large subunit ribosomal protein L24